MSGTESEQERAAVAAPQRARLTRRGMLEVLLGASALALRVGVDGRAPHDNDVHPARENPSGPNGPTYPETRQFDRLVSAFIRGNTIPGASVAVYEGGRPAYVQTYGLAERAPRRLVQPSSLFRIASISKPITAVAILKLYDEGRLDLDATVFGPSGILRHLRPRDGATVDPRLHRVTLTHLLQHTGGWDRARTFDPMFRSVEIAREMEVPPPAEAEIIIRYMLGCPLQADPGTRFAYSNLGYCILGRVIEHITGQHYGEYVRSAILQPMGIRRTRLGRTRLRDAAPDEVHYYPDTQCVQSIFPDDGLVPIPYGGFYMEALDSCGGWLSTPDELVRFASTVSGRCGPSFLRPATIARMIARPAPPVPSGPVWYGMGWVVWASGSDQTWEHNGGLYGTNTLLSRADDRRNLAWSILFNRHTAGNYNALMRMAVRSVALWPGVPASWTHPSSR